MVIAERYHDFSAGHRVCGHENKCRYLHGHNYRVHFTCSAEDLDRIGRVIDFGVIKERLCLWLEDNWDHRFLAWERDTEIASLVEVNGEVLSSSVVWTPFNPTAENMAKYLVEVVGPERLAGTGVVLVAARIEETAKCSASFSLETKKEGTPNE
jgi:6-pyruvoyltetrahydropterin/6-carboxytetrahydropterin synthase